jgi:hypothetical protein
MPPAFSTDSPVYRDPNGGWHGAPYDSAWPLRVGHFLRTHALGVSRIEVPVPLQARVQKFERLNFIMLDGWSQTP